jgi:hypothetical protein
MSVFELEREVEAERRHADHIAEVLRTVIKWAGDIDLLHVIAVSGSQITIGQVAEGALAVHELRRKNAAE